jgi:hypothetical protein
VVRMKPEREQNEQTKQSRWGFRGMIVRNWLELLIVPFALVIMSVLFTARQETRQEDRAEQPRSGTGGAQGGSERPWWRRVFGG